MGGVAKAVGHAAAGALHFASPIASMIPGVGTAVGIGSELLGGILGQNQQKQNARAQQQQYNAAMGAVQGPSQYEQMMQQWMGKQQGPQAYNMGQGFNAGQDALMQMVNRDPAQQLGAAGQTLQDLSTTGAAANAQALVNQLQPLQQLQGQQQMAALNAGVSGLGQRLGSAQAIGQARLGAQLAAQNNAQNAGIYQQTYENAANRQLQAAQALGGFMQQGQQQQLNAAQQLGQYAQLGMQNNSQNNAQQLAFQQMMQGGYGQLMAAQGQRTGQLVGLNAPQAAVGSPLLQAAQTSTLLPAVYSKIAAMGQQQAPTPFTPYVPQVSQQFQPRPFNLGR